MPPRHISPRDDHLTSWDNPTHWICGSGPRCSSLARWWARPSLPFIIWSQARGIWSMWCSAVSWCQTLARNGACVEAFFQLGQGFRKIFVEVSTWVSRCFQLDDVGCGLLLACASGWGIPKFMCTIQLNFGGDGQKHRYPPEISLLNISVNISDISG